jgi:hypothetical protein
MWSLLRKRMHVQYLLRHNPPFKHMPLQHEVALGKKEARHSFGTHLIILKVRLTPNITFGMCNIWVILRRKVMYLYSKKHHLDQLFHCQSSRYDVIRWIFYTNNKGKIICNSPNDIISGNFDNEKVDQDGIFYYKDILHFFFQWPKYYTYQKSY